MRNEIVYQPIPRGRSPFEEDMLVLCAENNLSSDFLWKNREARLYRTIKNMYIPNSLEQFHNHLDPLCMMMIYGGRMRLNGHCLVSFPVFGNVSNREWDIKVIIRTKSSQKNRTRYGYEHYEDDSENDIHIINTIKEIMTRRLLNSLNIEMEVESSTLSNSTITTTQIPIVGPIGEWFIQTTADRLTLITRYQCYFESDDCYHFHLVLKDPFNGGIWEPIYTLTLSLGSMRYDRKLCIGGYDCWISNRKSVYEDAFNIGRLFAKSIEFKVISLYLNSFEDKDTWDNFHHIDYSKPRRSKIENVEKRVMSITSIHPIPGLILVFAFHDLFSLSAIQVLVEKCLDMNQVIEKIKSTQPIRSLIATIFPRINKNSGITLLYGLWGKIIWGKKYSSSIGRHLKTVKTIAFTKSYKLDTSAIHLSCNYPPCCDLPLLHQIYEQVNYCVFNSKDNDQSVHLDIIDNSLDSLCFKIENETDLLFNEWKLLLNDKEKMVNILEKSIMFQLFDFDLEIVDFESDFRFGDDLERTLMDLRYKVYFMEFQKSTELSKIIKHVSFWIISLEFSFLSILFWKKNKGGNHLFKFFFWMKETNRILEQLFAILDKHIPCFYSDCKLNTAFQKKVFEDIYDRNITIEEVRSLIEEQCKLASENSDRMIIPTLDYLYTLLSQYIIGN